MMYLALTALCLFGAACMSQEVSVDMDNRHKRSITRVENLVQSIEAEVQKLKLMIKDGKCHLNGLQSNGGAVFTRWGRRGCRNKDSELIYTGHAAGANNYKHSGAAGNFLCLPFQPTWDKYDDRMKGNAFLFGAEYDPNGQNIPGTPFDASLVGKDVPCALCRSRTRTSVVMIPGRNVCYKGWKIEYKGYLMTSYYAHKSGSDFICVDRSPTTLVGITKHIWAKILYSVEGSCPSLKCPPYVHGREITCVVCTK